MGCVESERERRRIHTDTHGPMYTQIHTQERTRTVLLRTCCFLILLAHAHVRLHVLGVCGFF